MAVKANFTVDQGADFSTDITVSDSNNAIIDLTNYTGAGKVRKHYESANSVSLGIGLGGNTGVVTISLTKTQTESLKGGKYVYDVELTDGSNNTSRMVEGIMIVAPGVT